MAPLLHRLLAVTLLALATASVAFAQICVPDPCQHNARCAPIYGTTDYTCVGCDYSQWTGKNCDVPNTGSVSVALTSTPATPSVTSSSTSAPASAVTVSPTSTAGPAATSTRLHQDTTTAWTVPQPTPFVLQGTSAPGGCTCSSVHTPVCGADGVSYTSECFATCKGVAILHTGACARTRGGAKVTSGTATPSSTLSTSYTTVAATSTPSVETSTPSVETSTLSEAPASGTTAAASAPSAAASNTSTGVSENATAVATSSPGGSSATDVATVVPADTSSVTTPVPADTSSATEAATAAPTDTTAPGATTAVSSTNESTAVPTATSLVTTANTPTPSESSVLNATETPIPTETPAPLSTDTSVPVTTSTEGASTTAAPVGTSRPAVVSAPTPTPSSGGTGPGDASGPCASSPCKHSSQCVLVSGASDYSCVGCDHSLWSGKNCDVSRSCGTSPCQNGGTCIPTYTGYTCKCPTGCSGKHCESNSSETASPHRGAHTDRPYGPCAGNPCKHGSQCAPVAGGRDYVCSGCDASQWTGKDCDVENPCATSPCKNGGHCSKSKDEPGFVCNCKSGFDGSTCANSVSGSSNNGTSSDESGSGRHGGHSSTTAGSNGRGGGSYQNGCPCTSLLSPVCGHNGVTYINECTAVCHEVTIDYEGMCRASTRMSHVAAAGSYGPQSTDTPSGSQAHCQRDCPSYTCGGESDGCGGTCPAPIGEFCYFCCDHHELFFYAHSSPQGGLRQCYEWCYSGA